MALPMNKKEARTSRGNLPEVKKSVIRKNAYENNGRNNRENLNDGPADSPTRLATIYFKKRKCKVVASGVQTRYDDIL